MKMKEQFLESIEANGAEAKVWAAIDLCEYGYWKNRYPDNRWLQGVYESEFSRLYQLEQNQDAESE